MSYRESSLSCNESARSCLSALLRFRGWFTFQPLICVGPELGSAAEDPVSLWSYGIVFSSGLLDQARWAGIGAGCNLRNLFDPASDDPDGVDLCRCADGAPRGVPGGLWPIGPIEFAKVGESI